jgi:hypothetical protein
MLTYHKQTVGPIAIILSSQPISGDDSEWITRLINAYNVLNSDGGIIWHSVVPSTQQRDHDEINALESLLGAPLSHEVVIAAKRNSQLAHRKLADMAIRIARRFNGIVDMTDIIEDLPRAHLVTGSTVDGKPFKYQVASPESLELWLGHPRFRMAM